MGERGERIGTILAGRYRLVSRIGKGGMGEVYEAVQIHLGRTVAVKLMTGLADARDRARFRQEAMTAGAVQHPHVVSILAMEEDGDVPFLVMERLRGRSLRDALADRRPFAPARVREIGAQMLAALAAAHEAGIVHRDVKPENVFLVEDAGVRDFVKLLDFGIAKLVDDEGGPKTTTGVVIGTTPYMSPERLRGAKADTRSDLYAVGLCLREMLTGKRTFEGSGPDLVEAILRGAQDLPSAREDGELASFVNRATNRDPNARFASPEQMREALLATAGAAALRGRSIEGEGARADARSSAHRPSRVRVFALAACGSTLVCSAALGLVWRSTASDSQRRDRDGASLASEASIVALEPDAGLVASVVVPATATGVPPADAMISATVSARNAPAAPTRGECICRPTHASAAITGTTQSLCLPSAVVGVSTCMCETPDKGISICRAHHPGTRGACSSAERSFQGQAGGPCEGFLAHDDRIPAQGVLRSCSRCPQGVRRYPGPAGRPCKGVALDGPTQVLDGVTDCP